MDPKVECHEVVASINIEKCTPQILRSILMKLRDTLPIYSFSVAVSAADAAGCNWAAYNSMSNILIGAILPAFLKEKYPTINFDLSIVHKDPVSGNYIIFMPDMPHLMKNIVTALELSSDKSSKRNLKFGKCPTNLSMIECVWIALGGGSAQLQESKLTAFHFDKNAYSRMNVSLAMHILSQTVALMIRMAIADDDVILAFEKKEVYNHLANLCEKMNLVVDICNGRDGAHTPENALSRQTALLDVLAWFTEWKALHDARVELEEATQYNFFADETYFCIQALILGHVGAIQLYCVEKGESINPRSMNTDWVEWFFGNCRQMVGGSHNKLTALGFNHGDRKDTAFNKAKAECVGNNRSAPFNRKKY